MSSVRNRKSATQQQKGGQKSHGGGSTSSNKRAPSSWLGLLAKLVGGLLLLAGAAFAGWYFFVASEFERSTVPTRIQHHWNRAFPKYLTVEELAQYDGLDESKPIYLGVNGHIFDVTAGASYYSKKNQGGYSGFSGADGVRAFVDLCFTDECMKYAHCANTLTEQQRSEIDTWTDFYMNDAKYAFVGYVVRDEEATKKFCETEGVAWAAEQTRLKEEAKAKKKAEKAAKKAAAENNDEQY